MTVLLIAANIAVFVYELRMMQSGQIEAFVADFGLVPASLTTTVSARAVGSLFSSMFLHGGVLHLLGNMLYLWIFGNNIEDAVGHLRFVLFYLVCGLAAAAAQIVVHPDSTIPMIGASGAVSGVLGAYLLLFPRARVLVLVPIWIFIRFVRVPAVILLVIWFAIQILSGWASPGTETGGIAFWAHIGGFVAGAVLILFFRKRGVRLGR